MADLRRRLTLFRAGAILADVGSEPVAGVDALAVADGRVVALGSGERLRRDLEVTEVVELGDGWLMPGLVDAHAHPTIAAEERCHVALDATAQADVEQMSRAVARSRASNGWIKLVGWVTERTQQGPIDLALLDHLGGHRPLVITHANGHWGYLNSAGLRRLDLLDDRGRLRQEQVPSGGWVEATSEGWPTGRVFEQVFFDVADPALARDPTLVAQASFEERLAALRVIQQRYLARGVTSITEALCSESGWNLLEAVTSEGGSPAYRALISIDDVALATSRLERGGDRLTVGGMKTFVDGALNGGTCHLSDPPRGVEPQQLRDAEQIADELGTARGLGLDLAIHANGDLAIDVVLDAGYRSGITGRIEHGSFIRDDQLGRLASDGWAVVPFGSYIYEHGDRMLDRYGESRLASVLRHRSLLDAGVRVAGSSDFPCADFDPWTAVTSCATRQTNSGVTVGAMEVVSRAEALTCYTRGSAALSSSSPRAGTLAPGEPAAFTVVADDPRGREAAERLHEEDVIATAVDGELVYVGPAVVG